jgi:hypothetical protein
MKRMKTDQISPDPSHPFNPSPIRRFAAERSVIY